MTKTLEQFKTDTLGGSFGNPGSGTYKGQCVSYVRLYMEEVLGIPTAVWGHALSYWTNPAVLVHFDKVSTPQDGDIVVWGDDTGSWTGPEGHIAISYQRRLLNQNFGGNLKVTINDMFTEGLLGYLRPKNKGDDMATPEIIDLAFQAGFNKQATAQDIAEFQGKPITLLLQHVLKYNVDLRTKAANFDIFVDALKRSDSEVERLRLVEQAVQGKNVAISKEAIIDYLTKNLG
jgi:hypothetical protein